MSVYSPPWGFYYKVAFEDIGEANEARFQSVSGLTVGYDTEDFKEGGENRFVHKLPLRTTYGDLTLKRGMLTDSATIAWFREAFRDRTFTPKTVSVILMNEQGEPLRTWSVAHAVPKKWTVTDFNAQESSIVVETLELTYQYFTVS